MVRASLLLVLMMASVQASQISTVISADTKLIRSVPKTERSNSVISITSSGDTKMIRNVRKTVKAENVAKVVDSLGSLEEGGDAGNVDVIVNDENANDSFEMSEPESKFLPRWWTRRDTDELVKLQPHFDAWCEECAQGLTELGVEARGRHHSTSENKLDCIDPGVPATERCEGCFDKAYDECKWDTRWVWHWNEEKKKEKKKIAMMACVFDKACNTPNVCKDWKCDHCEPPSRPEDCPPSLLSNTSQKGALAQRSEGPTTQLTDETSRALEGHTLDHSVQDKCVG